MCFLFPRYVQITHQQRKLAVAQKAEKQEKQGCEKKTIIVFKSYNLKGEKSYYLGKTDDAVLYYLYI